MIIDHDLITAREYYNLDSKNQEDLNLIKQVDLQDHAFVVASYGDTTRFLLKDNALVIVKNSDEEAKKLKEGRTNSLKFYLGQGIHAEIELDCNSCAEGKNLHKFYDLDANFRASDKFLSRSDIPFDSALDLGTPLIYHLTDIQAQNVYKSIADISNNKNYKWAPIIHNCVILLTDIHNNSGFKHHFSNYFNDSDLLNNIAGDTGRIAFSQRDLILPNSKDENKNAVIGFIASIFKKINWPQVFSTEMDVVKAQDNAKIKARIEEIKQERHDNCEKIIVNSIENKIDISKAVDLCINRPITYFSLLYPNTLKNELKILDHFINKPYVQKLLSPFGYDINRACNNYLSYKDSLKELCGLWCNAQINQASSCKSWLNNS